MLTVAIWRGRIVSQTEIRTSSGAMVAATAVLVLTGSANGARECSNRSVASGMPTLTTETLLVWCTIVR